MFFFCCYFFVFLLLFFFYRYISLFLYKNIWVLIRSVPLKQFSMRTHIMCFCREIRKNYLDTFLLLSLCMLGNFACFFVVCGFFFSINFFQKKIFQEYHQNVKQFGSRSGQIWVQTVCKGYQQMIKVDTSEERVKSYVFK